MTATTVRPMSTYSASPSVNPTALIVKMPITAMAVFTAIGVEEAAHDEATEARAAPRRAAT